MTTGETARFNNAADKVKSSGETAVHDIKDAGKQAWDNTKDTFEEAKNAAKDAYQSGKKILKDNVGEYASTVDEIETYVRENPLKSVLIGVGVWVLFTRFAKN